MKQKISIDCIPREDMLEVWHEAYGENLVPPKDENAFMTWYLDYMDIDVYRDGE